MLRLESNKSIKPGN